MNLDNFFFLRPYWFLMLVPVIVLAELYYRRIHSSGHSAWHKLVDSHLLPHLTVKSRGSRRSRWIMAAPLAGMIAMIFALAGPTWEKIELPAFKAQAPTVVVLSLAQSMNATDVSPSRLARAGHKVRDILERTKGGDIGFIIYADRPFVAAPLTSDTHVITQMLPELSTSLMPVIGNNLNLAIENAQQLLGQVDAPNGRIIVIADDAGMDSSRAIASAREAHEAGYQVSVLGVGTAGGAALQTASGESIRTRSGQPAVTRLAATELGEIADAGGGVFVTLTADSTDVNTILQNTDGVPIEAERQSDTGFRSDAWNDMGYWLLIIPILLAPLAFRKNVLMALLPFGLVIGFTVPGSDALAASLDNLWQTPDQQGARAYQQGDFGAAAARFENPAWKAGALYRSGKYAEAAEAYKNVATPDAYYNQGNALARAGELKPALDAYDEALKKRPDDDDIRFNRELVANLLEQQKQQQQKDQKDQKPRDKQQKGGKQGQSGGGGDKNQDQSGKQQGQSQGGGEKNQDQSGSQPGQSRGGDGKNQDQSQSAGDPNQNAAQGKSQDAQAQKDSRPAAKPDSGARQDGNAETSGDPDTGQAPAKAESVDGRSAFQSAMDKFLKGNGKGQQRPEPARPEQAPAAEGLSELDQAHEQQLRAVPDDPSGLLRARIRQYYSRLNRHG